MTGAYPKQPDPGSVVEIQPVGIGKIERWARPVPALVDAMGLTLGATRTEPWICVTKPSAGPLDWPNLMFRCGGDFAEMRASWAKPATR